MHRLLQRAVVSRVDVSVFILSVLILGTVVCATGPAAASTYHSSGAQAQRAALKQALSRQSKQVVRLKGRSAATPRPRATKDKARLQPKQAPSSGSTLGHRAQR